MFGKSTSSKAKKIIRDEIRNEGWNARKLKSQINVFKSYDRDVSNYYSGGRKLVNEGNFACYYSQTDKMLGKIYGKQNVASWSNQKKWNTYTHLLSREINDICIKGRMSLGTKYKKRGKK